jgi:hypothetical protein
MNATTMQALTNAVAAIASGYLSMSPNQRGVWAPTTSYALGDVVVSPTGDIVTPVAAFTSGASYSAGNWNILIPAQNYGRELAGAESGSNLFVAQGAGWTDVTGVTITVPAGIAWDCKVFGVLACVQGSAASGSIARIQTRVVDSATSTTVYAFSDTTFSFPTTGGTIYTTLEYTRRQAALGSATSIKLQASTATLTGLGNTGFAPAAEGGSCPTTLQAIGR